MPAIESILSPEDLEYIVNLPEVGEAWAKLDKTGNDRVYFTIELTESIRAALEARFGLDFSGVFRIPMRWIKGDTAPHVDSGVSKFENTYLVYLNDSPGEFLIGSESYPITQNTGYMFNEGTSHSTANTGFVTRLLLGPMNEFAEPVGAPPGIFYYSTEAEAIDYNFSTPIASGGPSVYTVGTIGSGSIGSYTSWRIASSSIGSSSQSAVYTNGNVLNADLNEFEIPTAYYYLYPNTPCFLEGSTILCQIDGIETYTPVESLKKGMLVKTALNGFKEVVAVAKGEITNPGNDERIENRLYKCSKEKYPALTEDLYITGCHSILEHHITDKQREGIIKHLGKIYVTDKKYRLIACVDERAEPWNSEGTYTIYHFALENEDIRMNYGVYAGGGLLVETCPILNLKERSNMRVL
jgi:hypothetical protein